MPDSQTPGEQKSVYLVRSKSPDRYISRHSSLLVWTLHGDHLILLGPDGKLVAMFVADVVESCSEI
jgi:hypothetical protein